MNDTTFPLKPSAADAQATIRDEFAFVGDWAERYQYLIDPGRKLPVFPEDWKTEEHRLHGCQSMVWIVAEGNANKLDDTRPRMWSGVASCWMVERSTTDIPVTCPRPAPAWPIARTRACLRFVASSEGPYCG